MQIAKFIARMHIELVLGKISIKEFWLRYADIFKNKWNNIVELIDFNEKNNIPATFFIGVNNGLGLSYGIDLAEKYTKMILSRGFDCGVHGIAFEHEDDIKKEYDTFKNISGQENFGVRMHYLKKNIKTLQKLARAGYIFDSTDYGIKNHYKINNMIEFPLYIMDVYEIEGRKKYQSTDLEKALKSSIKKIKEAQSLNMEYLTMLFHTRYFNDSFKTWKDWYIQITKYCRSEGFEFVNYKQIIRH